MIARTWQKPPVGNPSSPPRTPDPCRLLRTLAELLRGVSTLHNDPARQILLGAADDLQLRAELLYDVLSTRH